MVLRLAITAHDAQLSVMVVCVVPKLLLVVSVCDVRSVSLSVAKVVHSVENFDIWLRIYQSVSSELYILPETKL